MPQQCNIYCIGVRKSCLQPFCCPPRFETLIRYFGITAWKKHLFNRAQNTVGAILPIFLENFFAQKLFFCISWKFEDELYLLPIAIFSFQILRKVLVIEKSFCFSTKSVGFREKLRCNFCKRLPEITLILNFFPRNLKILNF
jgi:hypothetical protein